MKIIRNKYIPFPGYKAINLFGVLFVKNNARIDEVTMNHESIHSAQIKEVMALGAIVFTPLLFVSWWFVVPLLFSYYIWYVVEFLIRWIATGSWDRAYRSIGFEREAYSNQEDPVYLILRKSFNFIKYM